MLYSHCVSVRVGIIGASGYTGAELLRLIAGHPDMEVVAATAESNAGTPAASLYPHLAAAYPDLVFQPTTPEVGRGLDLVFLAMPHGASQALVPDLLSDVKHVVDLAADFRLKDPAAYPRWYGEEHTAPHLLATSVHGIPELYREEMPGAPLIAAAGCYVTAASLALAPLLRAGAVEDHGIIVDAASGVSGAGRGLRDSSHFNTVDEDFQAYSLLSHRHTPEIEQAIGAQVLFTPHLAPMNRGILATCYARPTSPEVDPLGILADAYAGEPFVVIAERSPSTKATLGSNSVHLTARRDPRTGWVMAIGALDNLTKGASGQAIQCANLALGLPETAGLPLVGVYP
ncbi:MAG: N-acetyl-gamma-glutamyl-phosphate reductase [Acidimicrobiaceae bacterium]|nr:N-acetyl-gamma-glutamyl-phosphate reductase [Acidimicrobiaceae bacterium]